MGMNASEAVGFVSFVMIAMSIPLALLLYMRFAKSKYGRILGGFVLFILSMTAYLGLKSLVYGDAESPLVDLSEIAACASMLFSAIMMWKTFLPGVSM